jgi:hypothetical protein
MNMSFRIPMEQLPLSLSNRENASANLILFNRFKERTKIALAKTVITLALDELKKDGAQNRS